MHTCRICVLLCAGINSMALQGFDTKRWAGVDLLASAPFASIKPLAQSRKAVSQEKIKPHSP